MKKPDWKLGKALFIATVAYMLCSIFGCLLYMVLPPFLCSIGARVHTYLLIIAAVDTMENSWLVFWMVISHLYVLIQMIFAVIALKTGKLRAYTLLTGLEVLFTTVLLAVQDHIGSEFISGIVVNIGYCIWLFRKSLPRKINTRNIT